MFARTSTDVRGYDAEKVVKKMNNLYDFVSIYSHYFFGRLYTRRTQYGLDVCDTFWQTDLALEKAYGKSAKKGTDVFLKYSQNYFDVLFCTFNNNLGAYQNAYYANKSRLPIELQTANMFSVRNAIITIMCNDYDSYLSMWKERLDEIEKEFIAVIRIEVK